ncbi:MAG: 4-hydroxy-tetrahydrodipicolinate reductase, partial [Candidatus Bathyarchaeia archaeon]
MTAISLCVAGADGRMGSTFLREAAQQADIKVVGALTAKESPNLGKTLGEVSLTPPNLVLLGPDALEEAVAGAEIFISFTKPSADIVNAPRVAEMGKKIIIGTTGFKEDQMRLLEEAIGPRVPAVIAPNFSIGVNMLYRILEASKHFPEGYDFTVFEIHHAAKADAPSGTAERIGSLLK